ncbi:MAG TPA: hypothetical protein VHI93_05390, partial [Candidatus Thermoplasmatota archaeon]|nr:hypothetical protein [Candidatus Thermoplasmatota archaeon]
MDRLPRLRVLAALALLCLAGPTAAEKDQAQSLALSPPAVDLTDPPLFPGQSRIARLTVYNSGDLPVEVATGGAEPAGSWITATPATFHLPLHGKQVVTLRIDVPANASTGAHLGRIDFTPVASGSAPGSQVVSGVSGLLDARVDPTAVHRLVIDGMHLASIHRGEDLPVRVEVRNAGNVRDAYRLDVAVLDVDRSRDLVRTAFDAEPLTAGDNRTDTFAVPLDLPEGQYAYNLTATLLGTSTVLRSEQGLFEVARPGDDFKVGALPFLAVSPRQAQVGQEVRLTALFRNEGAAGMEAARFVGSILRDGVKVGSIETPAARVGPHGNATLHATYVPDQPGAYAVRGHVLYDGLRTEEGEAAFDVAAPPGSLLDFLPTLPLPFIPEAWKVPAGLILLLAGLLGLLGLWARKRRREGDRHPAPGVPAAAPRRWSPA